NNNSGVSLKDPAGSGMWVTNSDNGVPVWLTQVFNELTGQFETKFYESPGGAEITIDEAKPFLNPDDSKSYRYTVSPFDAEISVVINSA
ncbi:hypothetical protein, partial [Streptococcus pneumoniae]|uniref:hypothetical protein n=1 Tax=Streptococcus pneumoniae TaxID=1313 RepID=UPI0018B0BCF4